MGVTRVMGVMSESRVEGEHLRRSRTEGVELAEVASHAAPHPGPRAHHERFEELGGLRGEGSSGGVRGHG